MAYFRKAQSAVKQPAGLPRSAGQPPAHIFGCNFSLHPLKNRPIYLWCSRRGKLIVQPEEGQSQSGASSQPPASPAAAAAAQTGDTEAHSTTRRSSMALCNGDTKVSAAGPSRSCGPGQPAEPRRPVSPPPVNDGLCCTVEGKVGRAGMVPSVPLGRRVAALLRQRCIHTLSASANQPGWLSLRRRHLFCLHADRGRLWGGGTAARLFASTAAWVLA